MERIRQIQLAAQGSQRDQLLLERALRLYEQSTGQWQRLTAELISFWKTLMDRGSLIERQRHYPQTAQRLDWLEEQIESDPLADGFWFEDEPNGGDYEDYTEDEP